MPYGPALVWFSQDVRSRRHRSVLFGSVPTSDVEHPAERDEKLAHAPILSQLRTSGFDCANSGLTGPRAESGFTTILLMIKIKAATAGDTSVTFVLGLDETPQPTSVVGSFNEWNPLANPLKKRSNGTRSVRIDVPAGEEITFKYLSEGDVWFSDPEVAVDGEGNNVFTP